MAGRDRRFMGWWDTRPLRHICWMFHVRPVNSVKGLWYSLLICHRFLDKLGIAAAMNISVVMKQALVGGYYGLLDTNLYPLPVCVGGDVGIFVASNAYLHSAINSPIGCHCYTSSWWVLEFSL